MHINYIISLSPPLKKRKKKKEEEEEEIKSNFLNNLIFIAGTAPPW